MHLNICSRCTKQTSFSGQKIIGGLKVNTVALRMAKHWGVSVHSECYSVNIDIVVVTGYLSFLISVKIFSCVLVNYRIDFCCVRANIKKKNSNRSCV